jgi:pantothenate kinase
MEDIYQSLTAQAFALCTKLKAQERVVVVLAGPPGSGKSTIAAQVVQRLNAASAMPFAALLPMDGFHLPRSTLDRMPNCIEAYARRGASWTFDSAGVLDLVHTLSQSRSKASNIILAPSFDHALKDPVADGILITADIHFILLEGNYLLLDESPWRDIKGLVDEAWFVDVNPVLARNRIAKRHVKSGIEDSWVKAVERAEGNDLLNGVDIREKLVQPDIVVQSIDE